MLPSKLWYVLQAGMALALALLLFSLVPEVGVQAGMGEPHLWQDDYPPPDATQPAEDSYPAPEETQAPDDSYPAPDNTQAPDDTQAPVDNYPAPDATLAPTSSYAAPGSTASPAATSTASPPTSLTGSGTGQGGFQIDWGFFWIGFAIPVLTGSGVVLYLLDRRPDLFRPRPKL